MAVLTNDAPLGIARRAALVIGLWLGFWLLAAAMVLSLLYVPYAQVQYDDAIGLSGFAAIAAAISVLAALRPRRKARGPAEQAPLARDRLPALYALVDGIGKQAGVAAPVGIFLRPETNASISARRTWFGRIRWLEVNLGFGLFCLLSEAELGAVVAHEYGHFVGGDLGLSPLVYRIRVSIAKALASLESSIFLLDWPFRLYATWFLKHSSTISRAQEHAADALAARLFGAEAMRSALEKTHHLGAEWTIFLNQALVPAVNQGAQLPILPGFEAFRASATKTVAVLQAIDNQKDRVASPFDTHPLLEERVRALVSSTPNTRHIPAGCMELLGTPVEAESLWYERFTNGKLKPVTWETFGDQVVLPRIQARFANTFLAPERVPLIALVDLVADTENLWSRTKPGGVALFSKLAREKYVFEVLQEFAIASLFKGGFVLSVLPGEYPVMWRGDESIRPDALIEQVRQRRLSIEQLTRLANVP